VELKNYINIFADIKLNPFDCRSEFYPDVIYNKSTEDNIYKSDYLGLFKNENKYRKLIDV
jgi:hypothetical protein